MIKKGKILYFSSIILTVLTLLVWGYYFLERGKVESNSSNLPETSLNEDNQTNIAFNFASNEVELTPEVELSIPVVIQGDKEDVVSAEVFIKYDPNVVKVVSISEGGFFDLFVGEEINETEGYVRLAGALTEIRDKSQNDFLSLNIMRIAEGETQLEVYDKDTSLRSRAISVYGSELELNKDVVKLL